MKNFIFNTAKNDKDDSFDVKCLTQYFDHYSISTLAQCNDETYYYDYSQCNYFKKSDEDDFDSCNHVISSVPMLMDWIKGNMFYVVSQDG